MKKIISCLIALMMILTMTPYTAFAEAASSTGSQTIAPVKVNPIYEGIIDSSETEGEGLVVNEPKKINPYARESFDPSIYVETTDEAAAALRALMVNRQTSAPVYIQLGEYDNELLNKVFNEIFEKAIQHTGKPQEGDSLKWVYGKAGANISITTDGVTNYCTFTYSIEYYTTAEQEAELTAAIEELKAELALDGKSDYAKIKAIYDYMTANITYDDEHYGDNSYKLQFTAYAALMNKTSVCQGYSALFYRMALEYGIDARMISGIGNGGDHGWNIVKIGSEYYNLDATWDASYYEVLGTYNFFLKCDSEFEDHTRDADYATESFNTAYPMSQKSFEPCTTHKEEVIPAVAPTCMETGLTEGALCSECGEILIAQEVAAALGHDVVPHEAQAATCTEASWEAYETCSRCDYTTYEEVPATGHNYEAVITAPTCTEGGYTTYTCNCGDSYVADEVEATGHSYSDWIIDIPAGCETEDSQHKECACGDKITETIDALGHDVVPHEAQAATCTEVGWETYETCSRCDYTTYEEVSATGHSYGEFWSTDDSKHWYECACGAKSDEADHTFEWITDKQPTEDETGLKHEACNTCGMTRNENTVIEKLDHTHAMIMTAAVAATCTKDGNIEYYTCSKCANIYADEACTTQLTEEDVVLEATGHSYSGWIIDTPAGCETEGSQHKECYCGDKITEKIAQIGTVELSYTKKVYTGSNIKAPTLTVADVNGKPLTEGTDYTVSGITTQKSVGIYTVTVTFMGNYAGTKRLTYTIVPKKPSSATANLSTASGGYDDIKFSWKASTGASGYMVYYKKSTASKYTYLTSTAKTYYTKKNLSAGVKYTFKVVPYYKSGSTKYYNADQYKTASVYTLKKVATPTVTKSGAKVKVKWKNISGETGYQISKSTTKKGTKVVAPYKTTSGTYKTVSATKGKKYYYKVRAYKVVDGKKVYGPWSEAKAYTRK